MHHLEAHISSALGTRAFCLDADCRLRPDHTYYTQVQLQMYVCDVPYADFVVWSPIDCVVTRFLRDATMYGHFAIYESLNSCTRARFCCGLLEIRSPILAFLFSLDVSIVNLKNWMPSGYIPRKHFRQQC